jgi:hypothetical protein
MLRTSSRAATERIIVFFMAPDLRFFKDGIAWNAEGEL